MRNSIAAPWCSTSFLCVPNRGLFQSPQSACTDSPSSHLPALRCFFNVKICSVVFPFGLKLACSFLSFLSIPFLIRSSSTLWNILLMMGSNFHTQFSPPPFLAIFLVMLFGSSFLLYSHRPFLLFSTIPHPVISWQLPLFVLPRPRFLRSKNRW